MFMCRAGRLSAALLDHSIKSTGSFLGQVSSDRLRDVTLVLRKDHAFQGRRCFCGSDLTRVGSQQPESGRVQVWDSLPRFGLSEWTHLNRVASVSAYLSKRAKTRDGLDFIRETRVPAIRRKGKSLGSGLLSGNRPASTRHFTGIMQTRASSTRKSGADDSQTSDKREEQCPDQASLPAAVEPEPAVGKPNKTQQLKKVFKEYGAVGVSFHVCISLMSLGMFYLLISSGIDMAAVLCKVGFSEAVVQSKMAAGTSTFVLAYAVHKLFAPVRISISVVSVPLIVRYFRKTGLFKPPTTSP
ncbi:protein FAM210B, mitochondrial [Antennarius striatus]|uniref:protein FAM210B, mitochondrial n=1 Tax=Antennarius striatus TaxID=241820 RepID=UPI0035AE7CB9